MLQLSVSLDATSAPPGGERFLCDPLAGTSRVLAPLRFSYQPHRGMPSINMKLEMVTIIACEVDTEVFTSDKMQVRSASYTLRPKLLSLPLALRLCTSCCCMLPYRCMHVLVTLNAALSSPHSGRGFLSMGSAALQDAPTPRPLHGDE